MSAVAWYEFSRGPRTPEQLAVGRAFLLDEGVVPFSEEVAVLVSTEVYSKLTSKTTDLAVALERFRKDSDLAGVEHLGDLSGRSRP